MTLNMIAILVRLARQLWEWFAVLNTPQMYAVHCLSGSTMFPFAFALMPNRQRVTYIRLFQQLKNVVHTVTGADLDPSAIQTDFELPAIQALETVSRMSLPLQSVYPAQNPNHIFGSTAQRGPCCPNCSPKSCLFATAPSRSGSGCLDWNPRRETRHPPCTRLLRLSHEFPGGWWCLVPQVHVESIW